MTKVSIQAIANAVKTSRVSVWKALNNRPGVSESLKKEIYETAEEMGYFRSLKRSTTAFHAQKNVAVVVSRPDSSNFWLQIIHELARFLNRESVNLLYIYLPTEYKQGYQFPQNLLDGSVDAIVVLNVYSTDLLQRLNGLSMPKIFLDLSPEMENDRTNGDLLFIEGKNAIYRITQRLLEMGKRRIAFVGDIHYAKTNFERYYGFQIAFEELGLKADQSICLLGPISIHEYEERVEKYIESFEELPEAFVCSSDHLAHYIEQYFEKNGIPREGHTLITGFDNSKEYSSVSGKITTVDVDTTAIGDILAHKILFRLRHKSQSKEIAYVSFPVIFRGEMKM